MSKRKRSHKIVPVKQRDLERLYLQRQQNVTNYIIGLRLQGIDISPNEAEQIYYNNGVNPPNTSYSFGEYVSKQDIKDQEELFNLEIQLQYNQLMSQALAELELIPPDGRTDDNIERIFKKYGLIY